MELFWSERAPADAATAAVVTLIVVQAQIQNARLQAEQVGDVAFDRQRLNGGTVEGVSHGRVGRVQRRSLAAYADGGGRRFHCSEKLSVAG